MNDMDDDSKISDEDLDRVINVAVRLLSTQAIVGKYPPDSVTDHDIVKLFMAAHRIVDISKLSKKQLKKKFLS